MIIVKNIEKLQHTLQVNRIYRFKNPDTIIKVWYGLKVRSGNIWYRLIIRDKSVYDPILRVLDLNKVKGS